MTDQPHASLRGPAVEILRLGTPSGDTWVVRTPKGDAVLPMGLGDLLGLPLSDARSAVDAAIEAADGAVPAQAWPGDVLTPIDVQEIWAAGVTYERSREGRVEEAVDGSIYDRVYVAERPELFFKATAARVVADGETVGIRQDSGWDVPEAELGLVANSQGEIFGYVIGNDMSSRSIEGDNPLYLPQAKVYDRSCALGRSIVPAWAAEGPFDVSLEVARDGAAVFEGAASTASITRRLEDLVAWLQAGLAFPAGVVLLTGTGIVPGDDFTLRAGDVVTITIGGLGSLTNTVAAVGRDPLAPTPGTPVATAGPAATAGRATPNTSSPETGA